MNIHEAKAQLSRLVDAVAAGEEIIIARAGKPVARLVPMDAAPRKPRELGALAGEIGPDDFDDPLPEDELALFHGPLFPEEL